MWYQRLAHVRSCPCSHASRARPLVRIGASRAANKRAERGRGGRRSWTAASPRDGLRPPRSCRVTPSSLMSSYSTRRPLGWSLGSCRIVSLIGHGIAAHRASTADGDPTLKCAPPLRGCKVTLKSRGLPWWSVHSAFNSRSLRVHLEFSSRSLRVQFAFITLQVAFNSRSIRAHCAFKSRSIRVHFALIARSIRVQFASNSRSIR